MGDWRVDVCRASFAAFNAQDADAFVALYDEECEWDWGPANPQRFYRGHAGLRQLVVDLAGVFEDFESRIVEVRSSGDALLMRARATGRLPGAGTAMHYDFGQVTAFRDRKILHVTQTDDPPPGWDEAGPIR